jgi:hypothetical protein
MKQETKEIIVPAIGIIVIVIVIVMFTAGAISFLSAPKNYNEDQQRALSLVSYLGYHSLGGDSIDHYSAQKVHENGVAGIMYKYGSEAVDIEETVHDKLEEIGFETTEIESERSGAWESSWHYSWFSAANGDIVTYVTTYFDNRNKYVCIAAGSDDYEEDVFKIRVGGNDYVSLSSDVRAKSAEPAAIEHVAPLAGTIYAIHYPQHKLSGSVDAAVNVEARKSYEEVLALEEKVMTNETFRDEFFNVTADNETAAAENATRVVEQRTRYYPWGFFWICGGGYYSPYRYDYPGSGPVVRPRGTGYTIRGGGVPGGVK